MSKPGSIFISYRRSDSITEAGRIYDKLVDAFDSEHIFKDVDNIPYGADFVEYLDQAVAQCDVLLPLIGPTWLTTTNAQGQRRLGDPNDFVRIEIASALKRDILVVPLLLNGAFMPGPSDLPEDLQSLARRNAAQVRQDPDFHSDMNRLIGKINQYFVSRGISLPSEAPASSASASSVKKGNAFIVPAIMSGLGGLTALLVSTSMGGELIDFGVGILLFVAGGMLLTQQLWAWGIAVAMQVVAAILCGIEAINSAFDDSGAFAPDAVTIALSLIPVIALLTLGVLLMPKVRRQFR